MVYLNMLLCLLLLNLACGIVEEEKRIELSVDLRPELFTDTMAGVHAVEAFLIAVQRNRTLDIKVEPDSASSFQRRRVVYDTANRSLEAVGCTLKVRWKVEPTEKIQVFFKMDGLLEDVVCATDVYPLARLDPDAKCKCEYDLALLLPSGVHNSFEHSCSVELAANQAVPTFGSVGEVEEAFFPHFGEVTGLRRAEALERVADSCRVIFRWDGAVAGVPVEFGLTVKRATCALIGPPEAADFEFKLYGEHPPVKAQGVGQKLVSEMRKSL